MGSVFSKYMIPEAVESEFAQARQASLAGDQERARGIINILLIKYPNHPRLLNALGNTYFYQKSYKLAEEIYLFITIHTPDFAESYANLAVLYCLAGDLEIAGKYADKAVELNPKDANSWHNLGIYYSRIREYEIALDYFRAALTLDAELTVAAYNAACMCAFLGQPRDGLPYLETAFKNPRLVKLAEADNDLEPIKRLADYQAILLELQEKRPDIFA